MRARALPDGLIRRQHDHRDLPRGALLVLGEVGVHRDEASPQLGSLLLAGKRSGHADLLSADLERRRRIGLEVAPPDRVGVATRVRRRDDESAGVADVDDGHRAGLARLGAGDGQQHRRILRVLCATAGESIRRRMQRAERPGHRAHRRTTQYVAHRAEDVRRDAHGCSMPGLLAGVTAEIAFRVTGATLSAIWPRGTPNMHPSGNVCHSGDDV
ncbi:hypothetical protein EB72_15655 [Mycobacterium sp. SWH-M1]|nr:hypothetical protein EB72_15655 [Mycobacterium sp. SWH-M1]